MIAISAMPSAIAGRISVCIPSEPVAGSHRRSTAMIRIITRPSQYCGIDAPSTATVIAVESTNELRLRAAISPSGIPMATATSIEAAIRIRV